MVLLKVLYKIMTGVISSPDDIDDELRYQRRRKEIRKEKDCCSNQDPAMSEIKKA